MASLIRCSYCFMKSDTIRLNHFSFQQCFYSFKIVNIFNGDIFSLKQCYYCYIAQILKVCCSHELILMREITQGSKSLMFFFNVKVRKPNFNT